VTDAYAEEPIMPVIDSEVCYEGIGEACRQEVQRYMFLACMLNGACGHTYGANGLWQLNSEADPYGPSPHGMSWGGPPWQEAARLPGSEQLGRLKGLFERYDWWRLEPAPAAVDKPYEPAAPSGCHAARIGEELLVVFIPAYRRTVTVHGLRAGTGYAAYLVNPVDGSEVPHGSVRPDERGDWTTPGVLPVYQDWVLVVEAPGLRRRP